MTRNTKGGFPQGPYLELPDLRRPPPLREVPPRGYMHLTWWDAAFQPFSQEVAHDMCLERARVFATFSSAVALRLRFRDGSEEVWAWLKG